MTFLWAELNEGFSTVNFRYYNDFIWYTNGVLSLGPQLIVLLYKFYLWLFEREKLSQQKNTHWSNIIALMFTIYGPFYYFIDGTISVVEGTFLNPCRFSYFFHHVISVTVQPAILTRQNFEWWDVLVCWTHGLLIYRPDIFFLNYIYVASIFVFNLSLYFEPYRSRPNNWFIGKYFPFIYYCFWLININSECDSSLPYLGE